MPRNFRSWASWDLLLVGVVAFCACAGWEGYSSFGSLSLPLFELFGQTGQGYLCCPKHPMPGFLSDTCWLLAGKFDLL
jgi:hypothetical protein